MPTQRSLKDKFPKLHQRVIRRLWEWDPTRTHKYVQWMVQRVAAGEEVEATLSAVQEFHARIQRIDKDKRDLYAYKSVKELLGAVAEVSKKSKRKKRKDEKGYSLVRDFPNMSIYMLDSYEGAVALGKDTKWCITKRPDWDQFAEKVILVAVNKTKKPRDRFSKFAIVLGGPRVMEKAQVVGREDWKNMDLALDQKGAMNPKLWAANVEFYDERDTYQGHNRERRSSYAEIFSLLIGEGELDKIVGEIAEEHTKGLGRETFREVIKSLNKGRSLKVDEFNRMADLVVEHELFNVLSLFDHTKARTKTCRDHLWTLVDEDKISHSDLEFLGKTPALGIPAVMELFLTQLWRRLAGAFQGTHVNVKWVTKWITMLLGNKHLTQESKEKAMNFLGRHFFKMKTYEPDLSEEGSSLRRKKKRAIPIAPVSHIEEEDDEDEGDDNEEFFEQLLSVSIDDD